MILFISPAAAQAPGNDIVSWPPGLLLLASVLYATLGAPPDRLWETDPTIGFFLWSGLPLVSVPNMGRVNWVSDVCHFVSGIRSAYGKFCFWIRTEQISPSARQEALTKVLDVLEPVFYDHRPAVTSPWKLTTAGLVCPIKHVVSLPSQNESPPLPSARDFLLFAAIDYHVFRDWAVDVYVKDELVFSTKDMPYESVVDVDNQEMALYVVAAHMVTRPHSQSPLRARAKRRNNAPDSYILHLDHLDRNAPSCSIDFHSYAPDYAKVSASLNELAAAYYRVVMLLQRSQLYSHITAGRDRTSQCWHVTLDRNFGWGNLGHRQIDHPKSSWETGQQGYYAE